MSHRNVDARRRGAAAALLVVGALLAACGGDDRAEPSAAADTTGRTVVLLTYDSFALPTAAAEEFEQLTGATIEVRATGDSGSMLTGALLAAGAPEGDVIFGVDNTLATRALSEDLLEPFSPAGLDAVPERYRLDGAGGERLTPIDTGDVCVNVDRSWFEREGRQPPTTLEQLAEPAYRDLLVVESPVTSSPGLAFLLGTIDRYGEDGWQDYWQRLADNGVSVRPSWDDAYYTDYTVSGGDRPLVLSYASSPPAEVVYGEVDEPASTVLTDSCAAQVEYAGVLRGAEQPELARKLLEFMISPSWQAELPLTNFVFPVTDVALPEEFERWAERAEDPAGLAPEVVDRGREEWIDQWRDLME
jgi:thiamine transport system substrate-binding protein